MNRTIEKRRNDFKKYGKRPRDSQRQKLYDAERETPQWINPEYKNKFDGQMTLDEITALVDKIMTSKWIASNYPGANQADFKIKDGRRNRSASGRRYALTFPRWSRFPLVVLHELAHMITARIYRNSDVRSHGRAFAAIYLNLVKRWIGNEAYIELRESFKRHHVKYGRSPAQSFEPGPESLARLLRF